MVHEYKTEFLENLIILGICLEILFMFINRSVYFQLSGWYYPLIISVAAGIISVINNIYRVKEISVIAFLFLTLICYSAVVNSHMLNSGYALSYALTLTIFFIFTQTSFNKEQLDKVAISYSVSGLIITFMIVIFRVRYYELTSARLTIQFGTGPKIDPNYLGSYLVSAASVSLAFFLQEKKRLRKLYLIAFFINAFGTLLTGSRGALVTLVLVTFCVVLDLIKNNIFALGIIIVIAIIGGLFIQRFLSADTLSRLSNISGWISDGSNVRRFSLWQNAWNSIKQSPIIGYGMTGTQEINSFVGNLKEPAHCTYLEMWSQLGIFSLIILASMVVYIIFRYRNKAAVLILIATLVPAVFISAECDFIFFFNIAFSYSVSEMQAGIKEANLG